MDWTKYINSGFQIFNKSHKDFHKKILNIFMENSEHFMKMQNHFHVGSDQSPINFFIQMNNVELKLLPYQFNMVDMFRKEIIHDMLYTKVGWIYHFSAIPQEVQEQLGGVPNLMKRTYEKLWK